MYPFNKSGIYFTKLSVQQVFFPSKDPHKLSAAGIAEVQVEAAEVSI